MADSSGKVDVRSFYTMLKEKKNGKQKEPLHNMAPELFSGYCITTGAWEVDDI